MVLSTTFVSKLSVAKRSANFRRRIDAKPRNVFEKKITSDRGRLRCVRNENKSLPCIGLARSAVAALSVR